MKLTLPDTVPGLPQHVVQHANVRGLSIYTPEFFKSLSSIERAYRFGSSTARLEHVGEQCLWVEDSEDYVHPYEVNCMYSASSSTPPVLCTFSSLDRNLALAGLETCRSITMR
ncbi:hypothetical protein HJC10_33790 [Corallococcus exiguus]|uniref:hypothetical protein n=1 Tax=Corallococcus exiguus TaxID=83462 RepID=UPI0014719748|nr:hypothetical protein [Corallococcus exiguus]NNB89466.1 hypothetical protein [Corallococcus exiguus]NNB92635.1 hypothetical protein [Corallococcus exiguus]NNC07803.1 hypothetical protein [Corallococcus exiguus]